MRRLSATAAAVLALAAPASALAQSAGDDQYNDPFAGEDQQGQSEETSSGDETSAPAAPPTSAPVAQPTSSAPADTLPNTGLPAVAMSGLGALLLAAGVGLRRKSP